MQQGTFNHIDYVAKKLVLLIDCTVGLDSRGRNVLVCRHGVPFSISRLQGSDDWAWAVEKHNKEAKR